MHRSKGHRTSGLLFTFWLLLAFCSIPQLRWEVNNFNTAHFENDGLTWEGYKFISFVTFFSLVSLMVILNCFIDKPPKNSTYPKSTNPNPELNASILNRVFYGFFDKYAWLGWRRPLTEKDIYDINPENASSELVPVFDKNFQESLDKQRRSDDNCISIMITFKVFFVIAIIAGKTYQNPKHKIQRIQEDQFFRQ